MKTYTTFEEVDGMKGCMKRPIVVHAKQIDEPFRVDTMEGDYKQGKAGDYLMRGVEGELYICDKSVFEKTYDFVDQKPKTYRIKVQETAAKYDPSLRDYAGKTYEGAVRLASGKYAGWYETPDHVLFMPQELETVEEE